MARPVSERKFHVFAKENSSVWQVWCWRDAPNGKVRAKLSTEKLITGPLLKIDYTMEQAQALVDQKTGSSKSTTELPGRLSVDWAIEYMEDRIAVEGKKQGTGDHYRSSLLMFKAVYGGSYCLAKFTTADVFDFQRAVLRYEGCIKKKGKGKTGRSPVTVNTYCRGMSAIYRRLRRSGLVTSNPFDGFEPLVEPKKKMNLSDDELKRFLTEVDRYTNRNIARLLHILAYTGIRRSEVLNIARKDVNITENKFIVTNVKARNEEHKRRGLSIPVEAREHFAYFIEQDGEYPFRICRADTLGRVTRACMNAAELPYHTHCLRHTLFTDLLLNGTPLRQVQKIAGHVDSRTTERFYAHDELEVYEIPERKK